MVRPDDNPEVDDEGGKHQGDEPKTPATNWMFLSPAIQPGHLQQIKPHSLNTRVETRCQKYFNSEVKNVISYKDISTLDE